MEVLTSAQKRVLDVLTQFIKEKGYIPSFRELAKIMKIKSLNTVSVHLKTLERKGYINHPRYRSRMIQLKSSGGIISRLVKLPVIGSVAAGVPALAVQEYDDYIEVDPSMIRGKCVALKVKGDSMKDAGILEGDIVIYSLRNTADEGEIVVALFEDEATVKYFKRVRKEIFLFPANENYKPIPANHVRILGVVTGVVRRYASH